MRPFVRLLALAFALAAIPLLLMTAAPTQAADSMADAAGNSAAGSANKSAANSAAKPAAAAPSARPSPAFRAAMKRFLVAQNIPIQMGEQIAYSAAEQFLAPLAEAGVSITEPMQTLVLEEARKDFGKRFGDVEYLTDLYAGVYVRHFSEKEVVELASFWESPVAKKLLATTDAINETFFGQLQSAAEAPMTEFQTRMEKQLRAAGILGSVP